MWVSLTSEGFKSSARLMLINSQMPPNDTDARFESIPESSIAHECCCIFYRPKRGANTSGISGYVPTGAALTQMLPLCIVGNWPHSSVIIVVL